MAGSPRIIARPTTRSPAACPRARVRQGQAFGGAEEAPSLTAAARDGDGNMRSGRKNARGAGRTKEWNAKDDQNGVTPLDKESPIQAVCGKTARTVRREGRPKAFPTPIKLLFFRENDDGQSHSSFFGSFDIRSRRS